MPDNNSQFAEILNGLYRGKIVPYLGPGVLEGVNDEAGEPIPADSDSLIFAMNEGKPMAKRLMYEFPRAAMHVELKRGRTFLTKFLNTLYAEKNWSRARLHDWLATIKPAYVIDINRDTQLQDTYADTSHILINGVSRIGGTQYRFKIYYFDGSLYKEIDQADVDPTLPVLFKPMGTPKPDSNYIASDADYVDYITELMGGFAIPSFIKEYRKGKQYLLLGMRLTRDTERMVLSDMMYSADEPKGWALIAEPNRKEQRFCKRIGVEIIETDLDTFLCEAAMHSVAVTSAPEANLIGC